MSTSSTRMSRTMLAALLCSNLSLSPVQGFTTMGPKPLSFSTAARTQKRRLNEQPIDDSGSFSQSPGEWSEVPVAKEQTPSVADDVPTPFLSLDSDFVGDQQVFAQQADDIFASGTEAMSASELLKELTNDPPPAILGDDVVESLLNVSPLDLAMNADSPTEDALSSVVNTNNDNSDGNGNNNVDIRIISWNEVGKASAGDMLDSSILDDVTVTSSSNDEEVVNTGMVSPELSDLDAVLEASRQAAVEAEAILTSDTAPVESIESNENISIPPQARAMVDEDISQAIREPLMTERVEAPSVNKILKFAIPAIGVWLCSPLLSLIDTSAVGLLSGTAQQAALNPAVAVTDYAALLIAFMYTGTTNLVAGGQESDRGVEGKPNTTNSLVTALQLSGYVGLGLGAVLFVFAKQLLRAIIGNDALDPVIFTAAMKYVRIRALGMPAAAFIGSAQAGSLGMQDIRSPLYVLVAAAVVNLFGDMAFVGSNHPLIGGAAGAAWATVFSQYVAVAFFVRWLCIKSSNTPAPVNLSGPIMELTGGAKSKGRVRRSRFSHALRFAASKLGATKPAAPAVNAAETSTMSSTTVSEGEQTMASTKNTENNNAKSSSASPSSSNKKEESVSIRGFLAGKVRPHQLAKFPKLENAKKFAPYVLPVTSTQVGRVSSYVAMSHVVSSSLGTMSMAAQQVIVSLFYCLTPVADSLSLTAQSLIPAIAEKKPSKSRASALRNAAFNFSKAGAVFGVLMAASVGFIPFISGFFTSDPVVVSMVNSVSPLLMGVLLLHSYVCVGEGLLLGQKDLSFLGKMYAGFFVAVPYFMLRVKKAALSGAEASIASVWKVFLGYQIVRFAAWIVRAVQLQRRTDREATNENA